MPALVGASEPEQMVHEHPGHSTPAPLGVGGQIEKMNLVVDQPVIRKGDRLGLVAFTSGLHQVDVRPVSSELLDKEPPRPGRGLRESLDLGHLFHITCTHGDDIESRDGYGCSATHALYRNIVSASH